MEKRHFSLPGGVPFFRFCLPVCLFRLGPPFRKQLVNPPLLCCLDFICRAEQRYGIATAWCAARRQAPPPHPASGGLTALMTDSPPTTSPPLECAAPEQHDGPPARQASSAPYTRGGNRRGGSAWQHLWRQPWRRACLPRTYTTALQPRPRGSERGTHRRSCGRSRGRPVRRLPMIYHPDANTIRARPSRTGSLVSEPLPYPPGGSCRAGSEPRTRSLEAIGRLFIPRPSEPGNPRLIAVRPRVRSNQQWKGFHAVLHSFCRIGFPFRVRR